MPFARLVIKKVVRKVLIACWSGDNGLIYYRAVEIQFAWAMAENSSTEKEHNLSFVLIIKFYENEHCEGFYELFSVNAVLHMSTWYQC